MQKLTLKRDALLQDGDRRTTHMIMRHRYMTIKAFALNISSNRGQVPASLTSAVQGHVKLQAAVPAAGLILQDCDALTPVHCILQPKPGRSQTEHHL